ncbi:acyltransferase family protein [Curtobacterium sp. 179-B 9B NHS]|uniref:acyltransferase family protein n=1 Tax=Curtobacterium sp. 179-B 9B NHS TaxID=3374293 RepID=UPI003879E14F
MQQGESWRSDVQGLRAVAVLGVVLFHAGVPLLRGGFAGVDVFFVISGFLITSNLLREHARTGRIRLARFYRNRFTRLAPAAIVTVVVTVLVSVAVLPPLDRTVIRVESLGSLVGVENLWLAWTGTQYLATHSASAFQQFWSLGVEEQFYLVWGILMTAVLAARSLRRVLPVILGGIVVVSFATMVLVSQTSGSWAFFGPHTRAWEFAAGALVATLARRAAEHRGAATSGPLVVRLVSAWIPVIGLLLIALSFGLISEDVTYPGLATLVPVAGAAMVIAPVAVESPVRRLLSTRWVTSLGDRSYSIYLWHWPLMTIPVLARDRSLDFWESAAAVVGSVLLGWLGHSVLEVRAAAWSRSRRGRRSATPGNERRVWRRSGALVAVVAAGAAVCFGVSTIPPLHTNDRIAAPTRADVLAGPRPAGVVPSNVEPSLAGASADLSPLYADGCHAGFAATTTRGCSFGSGPRTVVLFGDSHAAQWFSPLRAWAADRDMRLITMTKSSCPSADIPVRSSDLDRDYRECDAWRKDALDKIAQLRPSLVVLGNAGNLTAPLTARPGAFSDTWQDALERTIHRIQESGASTVVLQDTPAWSTTPNRALSASLKSVPDVAEPRERLIDHAARAAEAAAARSTRSTLIDPVGWLCDDQCAPVIWNRLAYRDANHITETLAVTLRPRLEAALDRADCCGSAVPQ